MKRFLFFLIILFACLSQTFAQTTQLQILNKNQSVLPGNFYHCLLKISNSSNHKKLIHLKLAMPNSWKRLHIPDTIMVLPHTEQVQIISILPSSDTPVGVYPIKITTRENGPEISETQTKLGILEEIRIKTKFINFEENLFAGHRYIAHYLINSFSNIPIKALITINNDGQISKKIISIPTQGNYHGEIEINPPGSLIRSQNKEISLKVILLNHADINKTLTKQYLIIPTRIEKPDPYFRFPVKLSLLAATTNRYGNRIWVPMFEISGSGHRQHKQERISFELKGPDRHNQNYLSTQSIYFFNYQTKTNNLEIGTTTYKSSYLIENSRTGNGIAYSHQFKKWEFSGFINYPKYYPKIKHEYGLSTTYQFNSNWIATFNYFSKHTNDNQTFNLSSISGQGKWKRLLELKWEYAFQLDQPTQRAFKSNLNLHYQHFTLNTYWIWAGKDFEGYLSNSRTYKLFFNTRVQKNIQLNLLMRNSQTNMELDTLYSNAPKTQYKGISINWRLSHSVNLSSNIAQTSSKDELKNLFDYQQKYGQIQVNYNHSKFEAYIYSQIGETKNKLITTDRQTAFSFQNRFYTQVTASPKVNFSLSLLYRQDNRYSQSSEKTWQYSFTANTSISNKLSANINVNSSYDLEQYYIQRNLMSCNLHLKLGSKSSISFKTSYDLLKNSYDKKELQATLRYTRNIDVPIEHNKDNGLLEGQINVPKNYSARGITIYIGNLHTITDKKGHFYFSNIKAGDYFLKVDYTKLGIHAIAKKNGPYPIHIMPGITSQFLLSFVTDCAVHGKLTVSEVKKSIKIVNSPFDLNHITLSLTNGNQTIQTQTDSQGNYQFTHLLPGKWTISIEKNDLPKGIVQESQKQELELQSGVDIPVNFQLKRIQRIIKFQNSFDQNDIKELSYNQ